MASRVPSANETRNLLDHHVIGNKADAAVTEASSTASLVAYSKGLLNFAHPGPGAVFYVDGVHGSESNDGKSWATAVLKISTALGLCTTDHNDYIFCTGMPYNYAALSGQTFPILIEKNYVHIIGVDSGAPGLVRTSFNRLNGGGANVFHITPLTAGRRGIEIAGLAMQSTGAAGIFVEGLTYGVNIHNCSFGDWGAIQDGILVDGDAAELGWGTIDRCLFYKGITRDGIRTESHGGGSLTWTFIRDCIFGKYAGVGINFLNDNAACQLGGILNNTFFQQAITTKGAAITIVAATGGIITGNQAMEDGGNPGNNPYLDTSASVANAWGVNWSGDVVTYPATS